MNIKDIIIGAVCLILCHTAGMAQTASDFQKTVAAPGRFDPLPKADDAFWRDSVPEAMRQSYIGYGEQYLGQPWTTLPLTSFAEFKTNGNRTRYEAASFAKRRQLAALVMAEIVEGKGRFTDDIVNGLGSFCEETWWGIPAHYNNRFPVASDQTVDLFNAETAGLIAWTRYMLETQFEAFAPGFCRHIDDEITRRMLRPAVAKNYWWKKAGMNWNPWICSNWLTCVLICERDSARRTEAIDQIVKAMGAFTDAYPADGGCDEGTGYWDRAAASLYECIRLLRLATDGKADMMTPKVREMIAYIYKMYIGGGYCVNFADAHDNRMQAQPDIILPIALDTQDPVMLGFAAHIAHGNNLFTAPAPLYNRSGNFPALGRELFMLRDIKAAMAARAADKGHVAARPSGHDGAPRQSFRGHEGRNERREPQPQRRRQLHRLCRQQSPHHRRGCRGIYVGDVRKGPLFDLDDAVGLSQSATHQRRDAEGRPPICRKGRQPQGRDIDTGHRRGLSGGGGCGSMEAHGERKGRRR